MVQTLSARPIKLRPLSLTYSMMATGQKEVGGSGALVTGGFCGPCCELDGVRDAGSGACTDSGHARLFTCTSTITCLSCALRWIYPCTHRLPVCGGGPKPHRVEQQIVR